MAVAVFQTYNEPWGTHRERSPQERRYFHIHATDRAVEPYRTFQFLFFTVLLEVLHSRPIHPSRQISVMFLYSDLGLERLGNVTPAQMESTLTQAIVWTNEAMVNSKIPLEFVLVYAGPVRSRTVPFNAFR